MEDSQYFEKLQKTSFNNPNMKFSTLNEFFVKTELNLF